MHSHAEDQSVAADGDGMCEPQRAIERLGNMPALYAEVVGRFVEDTAGNFAKLRGALAHDDRRLTQQMAHSLKGLAAMCGAVGMEYLLGELEFAARDEDANLIAECSRRLESAMIVTRKALEPYRQPIEEPPANE